MISNLEFIQDKKNLLAFSAGTDSSALFFKLLESNIPFDIIYIKYNFRPKDSLLEYNHVLELQKSFPGKKFFIFECIEVFSSNIEGAARSFRHNLFEQVMSGYNYDNLITGHNLNDRFEWLLMQLAKGSSNLIGMSACDKKYSLQKDFYFNIVRPFINTPKEDIYSFLHDNQIIYFEDSSNASNYYKRNRVRNSFSNDFIKENYKGIQLSFSLLENSISNIDFNFLFKDQSKDFFILNINHSDIITLIDKFLKAFGYVLSQAQRNYILTYKELTLTIKGSLFIISYNENFIFFTPYIENVILSKDFKSKARQFNIPVKNRPFIFSTNINIFSLMN